MRYPHDLAEEFPEEIGFIKQLARRNHAFTKLVARYDEVNEGIFRIESEQEPTTDERLESLKKQRLKLKDEIAEALLKLERRM